MGIPNLALRGSIYWWRRKITISGRSIALSISLRTGVFHEARLRAAHLAAGIEKLRMAYGERGSAIDSATLKKIFSDALRWQLERILLDQTASGDDPALHAKVNLAHSEVYRIFARQDRRFTADDDERLAADGWSLEDRSLVGDLWEEMRHHSLVSGEQLKTYAGQFGFQSTASNRDRVERTILAARGYACREATKMLGSHPGDFDSWLEGSLADDQAFAFEAEKSDQASQRPAGLSAPADPSRMVEPPSSPSPTEVGSATVEGHEPLPKKLLNQAAEECIRAHLDNDAWSADTVEQVRAAIRLFDFACGGDVTIDDLQQCHVPVFYDLCRKLPNRWGKTKAEIERGLPASVEYGEILRSRGEESRCGFSAPTLEKHMTWIKVVIDYADNEGAADGHRPAEPLKFRTARSKIGEKSQAKKKRARDSRSNWNLQEILRLLEAPVWHGCADLDERFEEVT